jgi:hypothetical protein
LDADESPSASWTGYASTFARTGFKNGGAPRGGSADHAPRPNSDLANRLDCQMPKLNSYGLIRLPVHCGCAPVRSGVDRCRRCFAGRGGWHSVRLLSFSGSALAAVFFVDHYNPQKLANLRLIVYDDQSRFVTLSRVFSHSPYVMCF